MGQVGAIGVVDLANTETGGASDTVAWTSSASRIGQSVAGAGVVNTYSSQPSLSFNFVATDTLDPRITFTRASSGTYFDATGTLQTATTNNARFDYNPSTLAARGMLVEEQRTNSIRNNTMVGAVAGTPGTLPTNWFTFTRVTGLTRQIVGTGTENGITYIEINLSGTPSAADVYQIGFAGQNNIAALTGQTWSQSVYIKLQAGTYTGISSTKLGFNEYSSAPAYVTTNSVTITAATNSMLATQRQTGVQVLNGGATTAFVQPFLELALSGAAIDITLRIGLPQLEQGAFATSVISTSTAAATRSADVATVNTLSPWYNASAGTLYAEILRQTTTGYPGRARFSDGTSNNTIDLIYDAALNSSTYEIKSGGTSSVLIFGGGGALNTVVKAAAAWETNNAAVVYDANVQGTDTSVVVPSGINQLRLANALTGYIRRITYYPRRLSNADLQVITT